MLFSGQVETFELLLEAARAHGYEFEVLDKPVHPVERVRRVRALALSMQPVAVLTHSQESAASIGSEGRKRVRELVG